MSKHASLAGIGLLLATLACSLPGIAQPTAVVDQTPTMTAVTPREPTSEGSEIPPTATLSASATPDITATPQGSVTPTITPTYSVPILTVLEPTNCRTGPGEQYEVIFTYVAGKELEIVGRYDAGNFWLVSSPESPGGRCWLFGGFVQVTGSYWVVASVTAPPTSTNPPPQQVILENWEFFCTAGTLNITISWFDRAENEAGYRVFLNGEPIAELPANSTTYTGSSEIEPGQWVEYYIQVYGENGSANSSVMRMTCG
jgi:hypothetical protein